MQRHALPQRPSWMALAALIAGLSAFAIPADAGPTALEAMQQDVARRWPDVVQLPAAGLAQHIRDGNLILFDVRTAEEYAVSHIQGAIHSDPGISRSDFLKRYGAAATGKTVVFYCSVGVRSSTLASLVAADLKALGAEVFNLQGGIFAWHDMAGPLTDASGPTARVHPYSASWGRLLAHQNLLSTAPRENPAEGPALPDDRK